MNNIPQEQNIPHQLERLAAQRQLYSDAKNIQNINIILSIPSVIIWSILIVFFPGLQIYAALWGGRLAGFSLERMFRFLNTLGIDVEITVKAKSRDDARIIVV
ncbi:MAG: hypothetical protein H9534_07925 [Dolichospermum circinale Clear-D4]|jgi:hypothetical protein|nr:hypothetical protein [Dolichospermum circinale Clear-D4]